MTILCPRNFLQAMENFTFTDHIEDLDPESKYLVHKAKEALGHAYAPYSKFFVATAVLLEDGSIVTGTNQENAAYPSGMCAERVALYTAASQYPEKKINKMAVVARKKTGKELLPATSCGGCRQVMLEFEMKQKKQIKIIMFGPQHKWITAPSAESLLPFCFTKDSLEHGEKK
jgi:cytidine deaminase